MPLTFVALLIYQAVILGTTLALRALQPRPRRGPAPELEAPTIEQGRSIPVAWGTTMIEQPILAWWGNKYINGDLVEQYGAWRYYAEVHMALCHGPVDDILDVSFAGKVPGYTTGSFTDFKRLGVNAQELFGGIHKGGGSGGGVVGDFDVYYGSTAQAASTKLRDAQGIAAVPAWRGVCHCVATGPVYFGTSPILPAIKFLVRRYPNQLGLTGGNHNISGDANPLCCLYEYMTDTRWGLGLSPSAIDVAAFRAAGDIIFSEDLGISLTVTDPRSGRDLAHELMSYIDGVVFTDPTTGLITIKLARADYVTANLPLFNRSNARNAKLSRPSWSRTKNTVRLKYGTPPFSSAERSVSIQNLANVQTRGGQIAVQEASLPGISRESVARLIVSRMLNSASYPLASLSIELNRQAWDLRPGSVFRLTWPLLELTDRVFRVTNMRSGANRPGDEESWLHVEAVEDIFGITWTPYPVPSSGWTDTTYVPAAYDSQHHVAAAMARRCRRPKARPVSVSPTAFEDAP